MDSDAAELEETLRVVDASLFQTKWRLKPSSKYRLQTDILALVSRMRPCIMVDYGGKMPELGDHLSAFLNHSKKESTIFELLRVMVIDEMIYLIHVKEFADFLKSSLCMEASMLFVDLELDPPKMITMSEKHPAYMHLLSAQKLFSSVFHLDEMSDHLQRHETYTANSSADGQTASEPSVLIDFSCHLKECQVTIPTLNGWLLGYPVIYLFGKDYVERAIYNLSTKSLHIYQFFVDRVNKLSKGSQKEELMRHQIILEYYIPGKLGNQPSHFYTMSFTVPYELSLEGSNEPWAKSFLACMQQRLEKCKHVWGSLSMEVSTCYPQAIAL